MDRKKWLSVAMALALAAPGAFAAETERDAHHPGTAPPAAMPGMPMSGMSGNTSSMPMMDMMQMMMGQNGMAGHVEGRIAFLKAELKITDTQQPLWEHRRRHDAGEREGDVRYAERYADDGAGGDAPRQARHAREDDGHS